MLGPPLETFKANKFTFSFIIGLGVVWTLMLLSVSNGDNINSSTVILLLAFLVPAVFAVLWLLSVTVSLHQDGISYKSLFGSKEMRWDQVERFYYTGTKRSINFIPVGTYYSFNLVDEQGQTVSFGNRVERPAELGSKLIEYTYEPLFNKATSLFNGGAELDFGSIRISKDGGVKVKKWFRFRPFPWDQVADYRIDKGYFYVWPVGKKYGTGRSLAEIPNAFVLLGLLDAIFKAD